MRRGRKTDAMKGAEQWVILLWRGAMRDETSRDWSHVRAELWGMRAAFNAVGLMHEAEFVDDAADMATLMIQDALQAGRFE